MLNKSSSYHPVDFFHARIYFFDIGDRKGYEDIASYYSYKDVSERYALPKYIQTVIGLVGKEKSPKMTQEERSELKNNRSIDYYELDPNDKSALEEIVTKIVVATFDSVSIFFKICCVGFSGKTELLRKIADGVLSFNYLSIVGVDITTKTINIGGISCKLIVMNVSDDDRFQHIRPRFCKGLDGGIIFVSEENFEVLNRLELYLKELKETSPNEVNLYIIKIVNNNNRNNNVNKSLKKLVDGLEIPIMVIDSPQQLDQFFNRLTYNLLLKSD